MNDQQFVVSFGEREIAEGVVSASIREVADNVRYADITVANDALIITDPDYQAEAQLFSIAAAGREVVFTGIVDAVTPGEENTEIVLVNAVQLLQESGTGGLGVGAGSYALETTWSLLRAAGVEAERIAFPDFDPPWEAFEVVAPLDGVELEGETNIGGIRLLPPGPVSRLADDLGPDSLKQAYSEVPAWAMSYQTARTLFEAESGGLGDIDLALAWLTAVARYSSVALPRGSVRPFRRAWTASRISRRDVTLVRGLVTGRRWLRSPENIFRRPALVPGQIEDFASMRLPPELSVPLREALAAWRRAVEETDPLAAVVALWEAMEFYASGVSAPRVFPKSILRSIRTKATEGLEGEQLRRVEEMVGKLNEPPLLRRLRAALEEDGVPYGEEELSLLQKLRRVRNALAHGRSTETPSEVDLKRGKAIVNRMLVYRVARLTEPTSTASER